jgi:hypothetical protein
VSEHETDPDAPQERDRPDPRLRPPDPAGTQPRWDPDELLPQETPRAAAGRLWATAAPEGEEATADADADGAHRDRERVGVDASMATATATATPPAEETPGYSRYSARFQFLLGALLAVGVAAIALLVAVLAGGKDDTTVIVKAGPPWSEWRPTATSGTAAATQIADHVGGTYKLPNGKQLVGVTGGALEVEDVPVTIAIQKPAAAGGQVDFLDDGAGVLYRMNGIGTVDSRIPGRATSERALLLRREALELALYSFRYLGVSEAVVMFPPTTSITRSPTTHLLVRSKGPATALLFQRRQADVQAALARPLTATLSRTTPTVSGVRRSSDTPAVSALTNTKVYTYKLQQANADLRLFLVLAPIKQP